MLARKFARDADALAQVAVFLGGVSTPVKPGRRLKVLADEPDNRILECALAGRADAIVTGDKAFLALTAWRSIRVIGLPDYLGLPRSKAP